VRCPSCGYENPQSTKFCGSCGAALKNQCVKCNSENPPEFKFCGECGASLTAASPQRERRRPTERGTRAKRVSVAPPSTPASVDAAEGERKTVTALFADIKGSTELTRDLDPEPQRISYRSRGVGFRVGRKGSQASNLFQTCSKSGGQRLSV